VEQYAEENYTPLPSRIAHLAVIDVLAVGVSKVKGPEIGLHLSRLNRGLQSLRTSTDD
jgi:RpiR family carbohydrate utilization transcriptional regulator